MKKPNQKDVVAAKLKEDGEIDNVWAFQHYILRLSNKIRALKAEGWEIEGDYIEGTKNFNYKLVQAPTRPVYQYDLVDGVRVPKLTYKPI